MNALTPLEAVMNITRCCNGMMAASGPNPPGNVAAVVQGDPADLPCDAYVVPQRVEQPGQFGEVELISSGGANSRYLINIFALGILDDEVDEALESLGFTVNRVLSQTEKRGLDRIVFPRFDIGQPILLTPVQSATAIFGALYSYWEMQPNAGPHQFIVVVENDLLLKTYSEILLRIWASFTR